MTAPPHPDDPVSAPDGERRLAADALSPRAAALAELSRPAAVLHARLPRQPPRVVARVLQNNPFENLPSGICNTRHRAAAGSGTAAAIPDLARAAEAYLRSRFPSLTEFPEIRFTPGAGTASREQSAIDLAVLRFRSAGLDGQGLQLYEAFHGLTALRTAFASAVACGDACLEETVVPVRYLPELLVAAPVWFISGRRVSPRWLRPERDAVDDTVRFFCDLGRSDPFAYLFQLYNHRRRDFAAFAGPDPMPQALVALTGEVQWRFDFLVIATPYHDLAAAGWGDFSWPRPTGPFLFGFLRQMPESMFFLGRWSGSGVFPLITDMMAATLRHLREQRPLLAGTWSKEALWYKADRPAAAVANLGPRLRPERDYRTRPAPWLQELRSQRAQETWRQEHHTLARFAARLLRHFKQGSLFPWLRGESP